MITFNTDAQKKARVQRKPEQQTEQNTDLRSGYKTGIFHCE